METESVQHVTTSSFATRLLGGDEFQTIHNRIMTLIQDAADYLDVPGRAAAKKLSRPHSDHYALLTQELTGGLMRIANAVLTLKNVRTGSLDLLPALAQIKSKDLIQPVGQVTGFIDLGHQPDGLLDLKVRLEESRIGFERFINRLQTVEQEGSKNEVHTALNKLSEAFAPTRFSLG
jgi:regulator of CtrA degradation